MVKRRSRRGHLRRSRSSRRTAHATKRPRLWCGNCPTTCKGGCQYDPNGTKSSDYTCKVCKCEAPLPEEANACSVCGAAMHGGKVCFREDKHPGASGGSRSFGNVKAGALRPFSGPNYRRNEQKVREDQWPCALCGRPVDTTDAKWVTVVDGGARFERVGEPVVPESDPGHMGQHAVGPDCAKRLAKDNVRLSSH